MAADLTRIVRTITAASTTVKLQYKQTNNPAGQSIYAGNRFLAVRPVRVS